jgi:hypothetical protein
VAQLDDAKSSFLISLEQRIREGSRCPECHPLRLQGSAETIHRMLFALKDSPRAMNMLRAVLLRFQDRVWHFNDHEVVRQVADLLAAERLHICGGEERQLPMGLRQAETEAPPEEAPPAAQPRGRAAPPPEPPTFDENSDQGAQAGALGGAAQSGAPFCEVCARMAREGR